VTEEPQIRARAPLTPLRRWILRGTLVAVIVVAPYLVTYNQPAPELGRVFLGGLKPCAKSPNCVCTEWAFFGSDVAHLFRPKHFIDPIQLADDSPAEWKELVEIVRRQSGVTIVESTERYLRAERSTTIYGLIDDFELSRLPTGTVLIRSAARLAYSDFGRNRRFVERIRGEFEKRPREQWF
jgi:uncharacterized protein (DUF1499 family)